LSCGARQVDAHKLVLSACSPFFRSILRQNPHQHPLIYLKGVQLAELQAVLNFMYHGEVSVAQDDLNSFLAVAEDLQVKGLTQSYDNPSDVGYPKDLAASKLPQQPDFQPRVDNDDVVEVSTRIKQEPTVEVTPTPRNDSGRLQTIQQRVPPDSREESYADTVVAKAVEYEEYDYEGLGDGMESYDMVNVDNSGHEDYGAEFTCGDEAVNALLVHQGAACYACARCGKTSAQRTDLMKHIVSRHVSTPAINCQFCNKKYKNQNSLQVHISQNHRELWQQAKKMG